MLVVKKWNACFYKKIIIFDHLSLKLFILNNINPLIIIEIACFPYYMSNLYKYSHELTLYFT